MIRQEIKVNLNLECGGVLENARIVFHTSQGTGKVIWICHALTANSDPEDWWPEMVGPGKAIDTDKNRVVCVNMLGSAYGSEGPARENPATGKPWMLDFPAVTIRDTVATFEAVRKHIGIKKIDLLIGASNGGFDAIEWAISAPELFNRWTAAGKVSNAPAPRPSSATAASKAMASPRGKKTRTPSSPAA